MSAQAFMTGARVYDPQRRSQPKSCGLGPARTDRYGSQSRAPFTFSTHIRIMKKTTNRKIESKSQPDSSDESLERKARDGDVGDARPAWQKNSLALLPGRKINSNSKLKRLPDELQHEIAEYALTHSQEATTRWLKKKGICVRKPYLSQYLKWYRLRTQMARAGTMVDAVLKDLKSKRPTMTPEQVEMAGQIIFGAKAIDEQDPVVWRQFQNAQLRRETLELSRDKWEFDVAGECLKRWEELKGIAERPQVSDQDKILSIKELLFLKED